MCDYMNGPSLYLVCESMTAYLCPLVFFRVKVFVWLHAIGWVNGEQSKIRRFRCSC